MELKFREYKDKPWANKEVLGSIEQGIKRLKNSDQRTYAVFCGSTCIMIFKCHEEDGGGFEIIVTDNYRQAYFENKIFNN